MADEHRQRLTRNMDILTHGLEQIAKDYARHITLTEEDPETFGAGHYVLYPTGARTGGSLSRNATSTPTGQTPTDYQPRGPGKPKPDTNDPMVPIRG